MKEKVFFIPCGDDTSDEDLCAALEKVLKEHDIFSFIDEKDMIAVKTHFGEEKGLGYIRPLYLKMMGNLIKDKNGMPFLTETSTLYKGQRSNAIVHLGHANDQGFSFEDTGMPIIMADGLYGDEEIDVEINGKLYDKVKIASLIVKAQGMVVASHFTGHLASGFGAALKNLGMGCASRKGKMEQHSTAKPKIKKKACIQCGECIKWCPADAITMAEETAVINKEICIGCGQCLATCRFDAVVYNWGATYIDLQNKIVEHALGVATANKGKVAYINFLTRISKDCDCMKGYKQIVPDIGILISMDPVAIDAASLDLVEKKAGTNLSELAYDIPYRHQIEYSQEIGFGSADYELIEV